MTSELSIHIDRLKEIIKRVKIDVRNSTDKSKYRDYEDELKGALKRRRLKRTALPINKRAEALLLDNNCRTCLYGSKASDFYIWTNKICTTNIDMRCYLNHPSNTCLKNRICNQFYRGK